MNNSWLSKHVPSDDWQDKDVILENIIAAIVIEFAEGEKGFEATVWDDTADHLAVYHKLNNAYHWFKWQRPALEEKEDKSLDIGLILGNQPLAEWRAELYYDLVAKKETLDDYHLVNIVKYRKHLWT